MDVLRSSFPLAKPLDRALLLSTLAESLQTFVADSEPSEPFYRLARHALDALFADASADYVAAYFDVWVLRLSGLFPSLSECAGLRPTARAGRSAPLRRDAAGVRRAGVRGRRRFAPTVIGRARDAHRDPDPRRSTRPRGLRGWRRSRRSPGGRAGTSSDTS